MIILLGTIGRKDGIEDSGTTILIRFFVALFFILAGIFNFMAIFDNKRHIVAFVLLSPFYLYALYIFIDTIVYEYKRDKAIKAEEEEKL